MNKKHLPKEAKDVKLPAVRFIDNQDGTIMDTHNGVTWVKNPHTDLPDKFKECMTWKDALGACKDLNFAGHKDWRLPTVEELRSLVNYTRGAKDNEPVLDIAIFPDAKCSWYWTSTPCAWSSSGAWCVSFYYGNVLYEFKDVGNYVRPVRSSQ